MNDHDADSMITEAGDERYAHIDEMSSRQLAEVMNDADASVPAAVRAAIPSIATAIDAAVGRIAAGGRLLYVGAGTSGRIAVLDASECPPTFGTPPGQVVALMAGGPSAIVRPHEGAEDDDGAGRAAIDDAGVGTGDVVVGVASSGRTPFVTAAVRRAGERGALTIGLSCNEGALLSSLCDHAIEVPVGPEVVAGSTRLKAGTAQKLVLNMLSTIVMVRLGKTYGNLMVDLRPTNAKLRHRATRIVAEIAGTDHERAAEALRVTGFDVKQAILVLHLGATPEQASARLRDTGGRLRSALEAR